MKELRSLKAMCRTDWYAKAYSEYLKDVNDQFGKLIIFFQECLNVDEDVLDAIDTSAVDASIYSIVDSTWNTFSSTNEVEFVSTAKVSLPSVGYVSIRDIAYGLIKYIYMSDDSDNNLVIEIGTSGSTIPYQTLASHFTSSNVNSTVLQVAFETLSIIPDASAAEKADLFINKINGNIDTTTDTGRDIFNYYKELILNNSNIEEFTSVISQVSGIDGVADQADDITTTQLYDQCDMSKYTGSTPGIALDFSSVKSTVSTAANIGAKVVKGIFGTVQKGVSWLFKKASKVITETIIDPQIAQFLDPTVNLGLVDGFAFNSSLITSSGYLPIYSRDTLFDTVNIFGQFNHYEGRWIKLETKLGELMFKPDSLPVSEPVGYASVYWKPAAIDVEYLLTNISSWENINADDYDTVDDFLEASLAWIESISDYIIPLGKDATKYQILRGVVFANQMFSFLAEITLLETFTSVFSDVEVTMLQLNYISNNFTSITNDLNEDSTGAAAVTNANLIRAVAGRIGEDNILYSYPSYSTAGFNQTAGTVQNVNTIGYSIRLFMMAWMIARYDRSVNPIDYIFIPFSNNTSSFSDPSWRVKSDQEIADTRDNFIETAIVVAVIAAVVVTTGVAISKIKRNTFFKRKQFLDKIEAKSWAGESLTTAEKRRYIRYSRKQQASNLLDPFFQQDALGSFIDPNSNNYDSYFTNIEQLIH